MKKSIITSLALISAISAFAKLDGDGFYRVCNATTNRYIYVIDNKGKVNYSSTTVDMEAIELWTGADKAASDPASVLYFESHDGKYDIRSQGTGLYQMISNYVSIRYNSSDDTYYAYGSSNGMTKYLSDARPTYLPDPSHLNGESADGRKWYIIPIDDTNYFGVKPTLHASDGRWYQPFYAEFAFTPASGMTAYYIKAVDSQYGLAIYETASGTIAGATPIILACNSDKAMDNKLTFTNESAPRINGNILGGTYFCNPVGGLHNNVTPYDPKTMRLPGILADGSLGFVTADCEYVPRNTCYLTVSADCPSEVKLVTQAQYDELIKQVGITDAITDSSEAPIFNMMGVCVSNGSTAHLAPGIYIKNGKKIKIQ